MYPAEARMSPVAARVANIASRVYVRTANRNARLPEICGHTSTMRPLKYAIAGPAGTPLAGNAGVTVIGADKLRFAVLSSRTCTPPFVSVYAISQWLYPS